MALQPGQGADDLNPDHWASIETIFHAALEKEPEFRRSYVQQACGSDIELRAEVESMLHANSQAATFVRRAVHESVASLERDKVFKGSERFIVQRRLGAGGFGVVYQVYDRRRDTVVALKTLPYVSAAGLYDFKQEFRVLAGITHPNLVTLYELISQSDQWFFTMEFIDGVDFLEYHQSQGSVARESVLCQLVDGVSYLHSVGKLHCDLKPQNVLVDRQGRVAILDFGLTRDSGSRTGGIRQRLAGTPDYLSPEQAAGLPASAASDWYSIGVMLYQSLTNSLPYKGDVQSILRAKQTIDAPDPALSMTNAPAHINDLCRDLLKRDPAQRPHGREILARLGSQHRPHNAPDIYAVPATLIGRDRELSILRQELDRVENDGPRSVYIHGPAGVGKSALLSHFLDDIRDRESVTMLEGRCREQEFVPYKALDPLMDDLNDLLRGLKQEDLETLLPADMMALCRVFPVLRESASVAGLDLRPVEIAETKELRLRALGALRELVTRLAARKPVVIFIDDLQWGDLDSAPLLAELMRPEPALRLLFIGSFRDDERETSAFLKSFLSAPQGARIVDVSLNVLAPDAARDLANSLLDREPHTADAEVIAHESGGNPFYVLELVNYWAGTAKTALAEERPMTLTLEGLVRLRLSRLPSATRQLFETVAVAGQPVETAIATAAAGLTSGAYREITRLRLERLIQIRSTDHSEQIETYHDRLREVSNASLTPERLRENHHRLALAWESTGRAESRTLATHFFHAGIRDKAFHYAVEAGDQATRTLAFDTAAQCYRMAIVIEPETEPDNLSLRVKLGDALSAAGRGAESAEAYLIASKAAEGLNRLELKRRAAKEFMFSGRIEQGLEQTKDVLNAIGMKIALSPLRALGSFFWARLVIRLRGLGFRERTEAEIPKWELFRLDTCTSLWQGMTMVETIRAHPFQAKGVLLALRSGEPGRIARALCAEAAYHGIEGARYRNKVEELLRKAQVLAVKSGNRQSIALVALAYGMSAFMRGEWRSATQEMSRAEGLLRNTSAGAPWEIATAHMMGSVALLFTGQIAELGRRLPRLLKEAAVRGDLHEISDLGTRLSHPLCLAADDAPRAHVELDAALKHWGRDQFDLQSWWAFMGRIEIDLYMGRTREAWARARSDWPRLRSSFLMRIQYIHLASLQHRARAALALAGSVPATSKERRNLIRAAEKDAAAMLRHRAPWGDALAQLVQAGVAAAHDRKLQSVRLLELAEVNCRAANMDLYAAAAQRLHGQLIGGPAGRAMVEAADAWMANQEIRSPRKMAAMLLPGFPESMVSAKCGESRF